MQDGSSVGYHLAEVRDQRQHGGELRQGDSPIDDRTLRLCLERMQSLVEKGEYASMSRVVEDLVKAEFLPNEPLWPGSSDGRSYSQWLEEHELAAIEAYEANPLDVLTGEQLEAYLADVVISIAYAGHQTRFDRSQT